MVIYTVVIRQNLSVNKEDCELEKGLESRLQTATASEAQRLKPHKCGTPNINQKLYKIH